jgi:predicted XRE-type DNA-binding protein
MRIGLVGVAFILATLTPTLGQDLTNHKRPCKDPDFANTGKLETEMMHRAKISENIKALIAQNSDQPLEVLVILNVSKPDLSHLFGKARTKDDAAVTNPRVSIEQAEAAVAMIVQDGGGERLSILRNAASVLVRVDRVTLARLEHSDCVAEIVENARLKE